MSTPLPIAQPVSTSDGIPLPLGQKGPRGSVLVELKRAGSLTARELAQKLALSLNAIRHHLKELETEGLVSYARLAQGVGAPVFAYRLTASGEALFPQGYQPALTSMLDEVAARDGRGAALALIRGHFAALARRVAAETAGLPPARRLEVVARILTEAGYMAQAGLCDGEGRLVEHNCALRSVAERFPEMCSIEQEFLVEVLGAGIERRAHQLGGCPSCEYTVRFKEQATA